MIYLKGLSATKPNFIKNAEINTTNNTTIGLQRKENYPLKESRILFYHQAQEHGTQPKIFNQNVSFVIKKTQPKT